MKYTVSLLSALLALVMLSACAGKETVGPSQETLDAIKSDIAAIESRLPVEGGPGMVITEVNFDDATNTLKYKYQYTVSGVLKPTEDRIKDAKASAVAMTKSMPRDKKMLDEGITFHYDYYSVDNEFLYSMEISAEDMTE